MAGELTSILFGPCAGVGRVVLDPLPGPFARALMDLASMGREVFVESYSKNDESRRLAAGSGHRHLVGDVISRRAMLEKG